MEIRVSTITRAIKSLEEAIAAKEAFGARIEEAKQLLNEEIVRIRHYRNIKLSDYLRRKRSEAKAAKGQKHNVNK